VGQAILPAAGFSAGPVKLRIRLEKPAAGRIACPMRIPAKPISQSDLMPISSERSDAGLPQSELVIGIRQDFSRVGLVFH